jgi:hypothetical protein
MTDKKDDDGVSAITTIIGALKPLDNKTRQNVLDFVLKQLGIDLPVGGFDPSPTTYAVEAAFPPERPSPTIAQDIRTLAEQKKPKTVNEKVAVVAYYLKNLAPGEERRDYITSEDISDYFPQADFELPVARMALANAKNAGYLIALGNGQYRLNPVGHNLVTHKLPLGEGASTPRRKKRTAKKKRR